MTAYVRKVPIGDIAGCLDMKEAANCGGLTFLSSFLFHDLDVSVNLISNHNPGAREICQEPG